MEPFLISPSVRRRFILGRQGLWPGRRWKGLEGVANALHESEALQLDPLNVVARSQDIALLGRVLDYLPDHLDELCYRQRRFFDFGGLLFVFPIEELPYWRVTMERNQQRTRWLQFQREHPDTVAEVLEALQRAGPMGNRDFNGNHRMNSYRGSKDTSLALYFLWLTGEVMVHHRENFQRVYDLRQRVAPPHLDYTARPEEAEAFFACKTAAFYGLARLTEWANGVSAYINRRVDKTEARLWLTALVAEGVLVPVAVEGEKELMYALASDLPLLEALQADRLPAAWQPLETSTLEEVTFLAPLEICSARGRAKRLFGFDYVWEVYKPAPQRRWGYYTLPILYGDKLIGRLDPRLERSTGALHILGFWLEEPDLAQDADFAGALGRGLKRFLNFVGAQQLLLPEDFPAGLKPFMPM